MKKSLKDRIQKRYDDRDKGGSRLQALDFKSHGDIHFWKPKENKNRINILPYTIKTKNHPLVKSKDADIGEEDFVLEVYVHQYVGPAGSDVICPKKNFYKPCPICEQGDKFRDEGRKAEADKCNASRRVYYNIVDESDRAKGVQVFQASYKNFHKEMMDEAGESGKNGEVLDFVDFKNGRVVKFRAEEATFNKNKYFEFKSFKFENRDEPLDKEWNTSAISFDECMVLKSYEEIQKIFYGDDADEESEKDSESEESDDEEEVEPEPVKKKVKKTPVEEEAEDEPEPVKKKVKKAPEVVEDPDDDEDEEEVEPAPEPVKKKSKKESVEAEPEPVKKKAKKVSVEDDGDEDEASFAVVAAKEKKSTPEVSDKKKAKTSECPHGHIFGEECEDTDDCDECDKWPDCYKAKKALKGKK